MMNAPSIPLSLLDAVTDIPSVRAPRLVRRRLSVNLDSPGVGKPVIARPFWRGGLCPDGATTSQAARSLALWWVTYFIFHVRVGKNEVLDLFFPLLRKRNRPAQQIVDAHKIGKPITLRGTLARAELALLRGVDVVVPPWILQALAYSTTIRNNKLTQIINAEDAGGAGTLKWYDGSRPATGGTATTLLGTLTFSATSATVSGGVLTYNSITNDSSADATSTVTWGRVASGGATFCFDLNINASTGEIVVNTASIVTGAVLSVTSWTISDGNP